MNRKPLLLTSFLALFFIIQTAFTFIADKDFVGTWNFKAENVPEVYQQGQIIFELKDKLEGQFVIGTEKLPFENVKAVQDTVTFDFPINGEMATGKLVRTDKKLAGSVSVGPEEYPMTAEKQ
ncbi:hypothetical protein KTO58_15730 [Chitinophaga pendula]|uniref:hypothetical protein n=1 Tax=Chitinophaga TaxID=79328 RepID=UPI000BAF19CC|nr:MULTISPECIES: hypothetical protein [Chitinophaga]ASZ11831.1 hypothetical protein CK934_13110 [Chitinophaga sp. MD30]UCJ05145.1 hypothetical protein KTO58_15730 [Chitinophaga pendula]